MSAFQRGNIVVYRVGNGSAAPASGVATAVFLDEYTTTGALVQSVALPTATVGSNYALTAAGTQTLEGGLTLSADGRFLILTGFNAAPGTTGVQGTSSATVARVIGEVGADGTIVTSTAITTTGTGEIRSATSVDGSSFYFTTSATGLDYVTLGATSHSVVAGTPANDREVAIFGGQLYVSSGSAPYVGINMVGTGLPTTSGQTATLLTGSSSTNPAQFFFADLSSSVAGLDTLYVADNTTANGLEKFSLVGSSWVLDGKITAPAGMIGLTGSTTGATANLFLTTSSGIYALTDTAGYHVADNGTAALIAAAPTNELFRGIAFAPAAATALPTLAIDNPSVTEGNAGATTLTYTVSTSAASTAPITFHYATADGTATAGSDYVATSGTGTIAAGQTATTISVTVNGDTVVEPNETVIVTLDTPANATATNVRGTGTIVNDDNAGSFALAGDVSQNEAAGSQSFTINRTGGTAGAATISYAVTGSGAHPADAADFGGTLPSGTVTFADGETSHTIVVPVTNDATFESDETYTLTLSGPTAGTLGQATAQGTIVNDDAAPVVGVFALAGDVSQAEAAGAQVFTINRTGGSAGTATVDYAVTGSGSNPADATDFGGTQPHGTVTFADGVTSATIAVAVSDDHTVEADESYTLTLSNPGGGASLGTTTTATGTIVNDDVAGSFALAGDVSQSEAAGSQSFTINRTGGTAGTATISYAVAGSGAHPADAADFGGTLPSGTVAFADGETSHTIVVPVTNDTTYESDETYTLALSGTTAGTLGQATAQGTIVNDEPVPPSISIGDASVIEGDNGQTSLLFTVTASAAAPTGGISFAVATADGTATAGSDYVAQSSTGTIAAGQTSTTVTVAVNGDTVFERNETLLVTLSNPVNAVIAHGQGTGTIENDDAAPATAQIFGTDFAQFTAAGFAPGAGAASGQLDSNVWRVIGLSDNTNPAYGFTGPAAGDFGRGVINGSADPATAGVYSPSADHALVIQPTGAELDANGTIEARIQNTSGATATSFDVAFDWAYRNSAARSDNLQLAYSTDGTNFTTVPAANFATPATAATAVPATFTDQHEAVSLTGTVADGGYLYLRWIHASSTGGGSRDEVGIDNVGVTAHLDSTPTASVSDISVTEGNSGTTSAVFTIARSSGVAAASVDYATADGTAVAGSDYVAQRGTVNFAVGELSKTVTVLVNGDTAHESNETFTLNLSNATGFQVPQTTATATITNDDTGPVAIYDIQGLGHQSPFTGQSVTTGGIVTSIKSTGFYIQDATGDGNVGTSDAIFVATSGTPTVAVGNAITLTGTVAEYSTAANFLSTTELTNPTAITVVTPQVALPAAVVIATDGTGRAPPTAVIDDDNFHSYDPTTDGVDFYESLEGMRVTIKQPLVVANTDSNGQTFVVASHGVGATGLNDRNGMTISPGDNNPETIKIYEGGSAAGAHSQGDVLGDVTGVVSYYGGRYEVDPTAPVTVATDVPALARETTTLVGDASHLSYASFNIENFSPRDQDYDAPLTADVKVQRLATEIITALHNPNVIGLEEVQDNDGEGTGSDLSGVQNVQRLIDAVAAAGGPTYKYIEIAPTATNISGGAPDGNIRNGFLYDPTHVSYVDGSIKVLTDPAFNGTRKPLVADFSFNGQTFTAIDTHSTSRGGSDPLFGTDQPPVEAGDAARTAQATAIKGYVDSVVGADPAHQFVVNGDFNGFPYEPALQTLAAGGTLSNLYDKLPVNEQYSYYFDGYYQAFDNIIVSSDLNANSTFDIVHYNAGFTDGLSVTDHDQAIAEIGMARGTGPATAVADQYATTAAAVLHGTVLANDTGGGSTISVVAINGDATQVGQADRLASGAIVTLLADGSFGYDADGAFAGLAAGATATDQFNYTLAGGSTATATITVTGLGTPTADGNGHLNGTTGNDSFSGTTAADYIDLSTGGNDTVDAGAGPDGFFMGGALTAADHLNGGSGLDQVGLQGDYTGANALLLSATTLTGIETLALLPGGSAPHSYDVTANDAMVGAGQTFTVYGSNLAAGENLTFNGAAETDGSFLFFGGAGVDTLTGGAQNDAFFFGPDKFGATDVVHGGGGLDQLGLDGHSAALTLDAAHVDVEVLALLAGQANGAPDSYGTITVDDSWVAAGQTKMITAVTSFQNSIGPVLTPLVIDGSHETDGNLSIYSGNGNDTITGGAGADHLFGGLGSDTLTGGAGADVFVYNVAAESTGTGFDTLVDFTIGTDTLNIAGQGADDYASVTGGKLDRGTFDADLQAAVGSQLSTGHAVFFTASTGDYANQTFLIVDANAAAGYQSGGDYVFHVATPPVLAAGAADFITH